MYPAFHALGASSAFTIIMTDATIEFQAGDSNWQRRIRLEVVRGPHTGDVWEFDQMGQWLIGRDQPSNIRLRTEPTMSAQHFRLVISAESIQIVDLESTNGTWLNGVRVLSAQIHEGDEFGVGSTAFALRELPLTKTPESGLLLEKATRTPVSDEATKLHRPTSFNNHNDTETGIENGRQKNEPSDLVESIGSYKVIRLIGEGGMANVFEVRHVLTDEPFAMKLIRTDGPRNEKLLALFVREASLILRLVHPRIVRAFEFGFHGSEPFLVMELLPVIDLLGLLESQNSTLRIKTSCWVASRILQALQFAHQQGIVHRDVKLGNVLAYKNAHRLQIKLGDFGLAKSFDEAGLSTMTNEMSIRGTLPYMAPEQLQDPKAAGPLVDLFATGVCLFRMLTGYFPSAAFKPEEFAKQLKAATWLPDILVNVLRKSMFADPGKRYQSAEEMSQALLVFHEKTK